MLADEQTPPSATDFLRFQHRRIEQMLVLLSADPRPDRRTVARVALEVASYLKAEEALLRPLLERAWHRSLAERCALHPDLRRALARLGVRVADVAQRQFLLRELLTAFREHTRRLERVALPWMEDSMSPSTLDVLRRDLLDRQDDDRGRRGGSGHAT